MTSKPETGTKPLSLVWMRRDLRMHDHSGLREACLRDGDVQPVFLFDKDILAHFSNPKDKRVSFLAHCLCHLHQQCKAMGGGMLVLYGSPSEAIPAVTRCLQPQTLIAAEDFEPATIKRDEQVSKYLRAGTDFVHVLDHVMMHPKDVLKDDGEPYKVYTPYSKLWRSKLEKHSFAERVVHLEGRLADYAEMMSGIEQLDEVKVLNPEDGPEAMLNAMGYEAVELGEWSVDDAQKRLVDFVDHHIKDYKEQRDMVSAEGTSKLSPYLRFGLVSIRECARLAMTHEGKGSETWLNELIWREFYVSVLYHFPEVVEHEFQEKYRGTLEWRQDDDAWEAFKQGKTGYPIVDAAMRQLLETGWMHNRARMIVASFLTKDLHMDWRLGEQHFADYLMDYDLASNNGGWQWAASTGTDAQPYFRIFNPESQSKKFDSDGAYIKRWVPELAEIQPKYIHAPHKSPDLFVKAHYPEPIVDHAEARESALKMFKVAS